MFLRHHAAARPAVVGAVGDVYTRMGYRRSPLCYFVFTTKRPHKYKREGMHKAFIGNLIFSSGSDSAIYPCFINWSDPDRCNRDVIILRLIVPMFGGASQQRFRKMMSRFIRGVAPQHLL